VWVRFDVAPPSEYNGGANPFVVPESELQAVRPKRCGMTREEVWGLSGEALDLAVAREVMEHEVILKDGGPPEVVLDGVCAPVPHYSGPMGTAWRVFERLAAPGCTVSLEYDGVDAVACVSWRPAPDQPWEGKIGRDSSPSVAICRAALLAALAGVRRMAEQEGVE
jgi:hypothetical protein